MIATLRRFGGRAHNGKMELYPFIFSRCTGCLQFHSQATSHYGGVCVDAQRFHPSPNDPRLRNRDDEAPTALSVLRLLRQDFVSEVPGQQKGVIRHCLQELLGRVNGKMDAGHVSSLLVRIAIDDEIQGLLTNAAVIQERAALGGCAVSGNSGPLALQIPEKTAQRPLDLLDAISEAAVEA